MNKYIFDGVLITDPEVKELKKAKVVKFNVRNTEGYRLGNGETAENILYLNCEAWGKLGDSVSSDLRKGDKVNLEGKIVVEKWEDEKGEKKIRYVVKIFGYEKV